MQALTCSRPFASRVQHSRTTAHGSRPGCPSYVHHSKQQQQSRQQCQALSFAASSSIAGCSCNSFAGTAVSSAQLLDTSSSAGITQRQITRMGNPGANGPFAPLVRVARDVIGKKRFNQLRGKAISLHSQVIKEFTGKFLGASSQQQQALIRTAKKNGEKLGYQRLSKHLSMAQILGLKAAW